jgi:hypothetical protein
MVERGILRWSYEAVCHWQRCGISCLCLIVRTLTHATYLTDSLDYLSELTATLFSPIPNRGQVPLLSIPDHPFGPEEKGVRFALISRLCHLAVTTPNIDLGLHSNDQGFPCHGNIFSDR